MSPRYEFFEHTADIGVHVYGAGLPELFANAAAALYEALGKWVQTGQQRQETVRIQANSNEDLLHDWLSELLFQFETNRVLFDRFEFQQLTPTGITAVATGYVVDWARSEPREEIKAVTYHRLAVEQRLDGTWRATVIFDV